MSKSLNLILGSVGGTAVVLTTAYMLADGFVTDPPAPGTSPVMASVTSPEPAPEPAVETAAESDAAMEQTAEAGAEPAEMAAAGAEPQEMADAGAEPADSAETGAESEKMAEAGSAATAEDMSGDAPQPEAMAGTEAAATADTPAETEAAPQDLAETEAATATQETAEAGAEVAATGETKAEAEGEPAETEETTAEADAAPTETGETMAEADAAPTETGETMADADAAPAETGETLAEAEPAPAGEETAGAGSEPMDTAVDDAAPMEDSAQPAADTRTAQATDGTGGFGLGRPALEEEIAAWNLDVSPDGTGLPEGSGDVWTGDEIFAENCASCHGDFAEGRGNWPKLAGGKGTLADKDPLKTVGSYWPHLSTAWDYINRSMPFGAAQTLTPDEVYAITAYILYSNDLVGDDFVLSHENFTEVVLPNVDGFIVDDRPETEYPAWRAEPCMEDCKDSVEITMRAAVLDVTPEDEGADEEASMDDGPSVATEAPEAETAAAEPEAEAETAAAEPEAEAETAAAEPEAAALDMDLVAAGERVFKKCQACHQVGEGAKNRTGPMLNGVYGAPVGHIEGFRYSRAMETLGEEGAVWDDESLAAFLAKPKDYIPKTKMSFNGLRKDEEIAAVIEYLKSVSQ